MLSWLQCKNAVLYWKSDSYADKGEGMVMIGLLDEEFKGSEKRKNISGLFFPDDIGNPPFT